MEQGLEERVEELNERIRNAYASVTPQMLSDVGQACTK